MSTPTPRDVARGHVRATFSADNTEDLGVLADELLGLIRFTPVDQPGTAAPARTWSTWRQGRSQPHNVYMDDVHRLVVLGEPTDAAELAGDVVASLNADARRGVVVGGTDGPDQGDPAAWGVEYLSNGEVHGRPTRRDAEQSPCVLSGIARVVPLYLRAPGAVAAAPVLHFVTTDDGQWHAYADMDEALAAVERHDGRVTTVSPGNHGDRADAVAEGDAAFKRRLRALLDEVAAESGAVAAAPPGDACPDCDGTGEDREATGGRCGTCWHGRVPPAGHEDKAAAPPGEPYQWAVEGPDVRTFDMEDDAREFAESWNATQEEGLLPVLVFPLYRAPVAAAPPGGEVSDRVRDGVCLDCGGAVLPSGEHLDPGRHLAALAAPPAGHEDEATVERAALIDRALDAPEGDDEHHPEALVKGPTTESGWLTRACSCEEFAWPCPYWLLNENARLRAALAAARGPRPVEDEAAVERAARAAYAAFNGEEMPAQSIRLGQWRSVARAALAASRGPRTPDPGAGA